MSPDSIHAPVLLNEVLEVLDPKSGAFFIDGTLGGGGHAQVLMERVGPTGTFLGLDWSAEAILAARERFQGAPVGKLTLVQGNYADLPAILEREKLPKANGVLLDLGLSSDELETSGRGFSFRKDEPLDMRYDPDSGDPTAAELLNRLSEEKLAEALRTLGEERFDGRIARTIVEARTRKRILRSSELAAIVLGAVPTQYTRARIHPATRTFQALRILVNHELENVERFLGNIFDIVVPGGRAAIITFHSLEDRIVKNYFRDYAHKGRAQLLTKKPLAPGLLETQENPRSRSAKLRSIELL